jgi:hypothetical protein
LQGFHLGFMFFQKPEAGAHNVAGRTVTAGLHLAFNEVREVVPQ